MSLIRAAIEDITGSRIEGENFSSFIWKNGTSTKIQLIHYWEGITNEQGNISAGIEKRTEDPAAV